MKVTAFIKKYETQCIIAACMLFVTCISVFLFMGKSLRLDEAQSLFQTNGTFVGTVRLIAEDIHLPVYFVALQIYQLFVGTSEFAIRSLSLIFLLAALPAMYALGKEAYSRDVGIAAVILSSLSPFLNWFGAETRMYSLLFLITILNQLFFIRIWKGGNRKNWILYGILTCIGVYTHFFFTFILFVQAVFFFTHIKIFPKGSFVKLSLISVISGTMLAAWFYLRSVVGSSNSAPLLVPPSSVDVFNVFSHFIIGFQSTTLNTFFLSLWPLTVLIGFTLLTKHHDMTPRTKYFLMSLIIPIALVFIISSTIRALFLSRYLTIVLPSLFLLIIHFLSLYPRKVFIRFTVILFTLTFTSLSVQVFSSKAPVNENFREVAAFVNEATNPDDLFVVSAPFLTYPIEYYYKGAARLTTFPIWNRYEEVKQIPEFSEEYMREKFTNWSKDYSNLYILMGYDQGYEEQTRLYLDNNFERISVTEFSPKLNLYVYKLRYK